jgi:hypothetical protein
VFARRSRAREQPFAICLSIPRPLPYRDALQQIQDFLAQGRRQNRPSSASSYSLLHPASPLSRMCQLFQAFRVCFHMTGIRCSNSTKCLPSRFGGPEIRRAGSWSRSCAAAAGGGRVRDAPAHYAMRATACLRCHRMARAVAQGEDCLPRGACPRRAACEPAAQPSLTIGRRSAW